MTFFDYETLKLIWWGIIGFIIIGAAVMGGFDMGVAMLLPIIGKTDDERRVVINSIGSTWEGNQTWMIVALIAVLGAWPVAFGAALSALYLVIIVMIFALFLRPVAFDYRSKLPSAQWRNGWDMALFAGGLIPTLLFGAAFGNLLLGIPFHFDDSMRSFYTGNLLGLLSPFALMCGVVSVSMTVMHGAIYLRMRTQGAIQQRALQAATWAGVAFIASFALAGLWICTRVKGYQIEQIGDINSALNPLHKTVTQTIGGWTHNYQTYTWMTLAPIASFAATPLAILSAKYQWLRISFILSCLVVIGTVLTAGFSMFPFVLPSSTDLNSSLTLWDAVSSQKTLGLTLIIASLLLPLIVLYTSWVFRVLRGKITVEHIQENTHTAY